MNQIHTKRKVTLKGLLSYVNDELEAFFPLTKNAAYERIYCPKFIDWKDYFPSVIIRAANRLERKGLVKIERTSEGIKVKITNKGKTETLQFELDKFHPKSGKWDGKWRIVFFDIETNKNATRKFLVKHLKQLGLQEFQRSVYITPYDISNEIKYLREVLSVPNEIKMGILEYVDNSEDLRALFHL